MAKLQVVVSILCRALPCHQPNTTNHLTLMFEGYRSSMVLYVRSAVLRQASIRANACVMPLKGTLLWSSCFQKARIANSAALCVRRTCLHGQVISSATTSKKSACS